MDGRLLHRVDPDDRDLVPPVPHRFHCGRQQMEETVIRILNPAVSWTTCRYLVGERGSETVVAIA
jgi:hypothetical protein